MFARLFAQAGLSLDRLRALVEVGAHGSIVRAAEGDPARQSQFSRQIKELEDFFQAALVERHGKGVRLTASGRELARISRFFLLGLSNFHRGCQDEEQTYRIGASTTFIHRFLLAALATPRSPRRGIRFTIETLDDPEVERRLHEMALDFGVVSKASLSRPLQTKELGQWRLKLWVPKSLGLDARQAAAALESNTLPIAWPVKELPLSEPEGAAVGEPTLACDTFLDARAALATQNLAAVLPDYLKPDDATKSFAVVRFPALEKRCFKFCLAWNPRLLRLNPHAASQRDALITTLTRQFATART